jgi:hypothetical protein
MSCLEMTLCWNCHKYHIKLIKLERTQKWIPVSEASGKPHYCYNEDTRKANVSPDYTKRQLEYFKVVSGPDGTKGKRELELLRVLFRPTMVMVEAFRKEMMDKYGIDPYAIPEKPKKLQEKL